MNSEFREHYERELRLLYEQSRDFAAEYPGIADRLGGFSSETMDPGLKGLLEGSAYLAARVQLKLATEFGEFTTALLEQLLPNYLAPTPSSVLVQATPQYDNPNLRAGLSYATGSYMDATYVERERRISCRYRLGSDLVVWPLRIEDLLAARHISSSFLRSACQNKFIPSPSELPKRHYASSPRSIPSRSRRACMGAKSVHSAMCSGCPILAST